MNNWDRRVRVWHKEKKIMYPSAPMYKTNFFDCDTGNLILIFSTGLKDKNGVEAYHKDRPLCWIIKEKGIARQGFGGF